MLRVNSINSNNRHTPKASFTANVTISRKGKDVLKKFADKDDEYYNMFNYAIGSMNHRSNQKSFPFSKNKFRKNIANGFLKELKNHTDKLKIDGEFHLGKDKNEKLIVNYTDNSNKIKTQVKFKNLKLITSKIYIEPETLYKKAHCYVEIETYNSAINRILTEVANNLESQGIASKFKQFANKNSIDSLSQKLEILKANLYKNH